MYPPTATGNVAPLRTIAGTATGVAGGVFGIAVDAASHVYASNHYRNSITEYAAGANGNVVPIATLTGPATGVQQPTGIALDPAGHLWSTMRPASRSMRPERTATSRRSRRSPARRSVRLR